MFYVGLRSLNSDSYINRVRRFAPRRAGRNSCRRKFSHLLRALRIGRVQTNSYLALTQVPHFFGTLNMPIAFLILNQSIKNSFKRLPRKHYWIRVKSADPPPVRRITTRKFFRQSRIKSYSFYFNFRREITKDIGVRRMKGHGWCNQH